MYIYIHACSDVGNFLLLPVVCMKILFKPKPKQLVAEDGNILSYAMHRKWVWIKRKAIVNCWVHWAWSKHKKRGLFVFVSFKIYEDVVYVLVGNTRLFLVRYSLWLIMTYCKVYVIVFAPPPKPTMPFMVLKSSSWVDFLPWWKLELLCIIQFYYDRH